MAERPDHAERMAQGTPGSDAARRRGCACPVMDNARGRGAYGGVAGVYWISERCPVHAGGKDGER